MLPQLGHDYRCFIAPILHLCSQVTSNYLDLMRRLKTRLVRLKTRVETVKEVLEKYMEDEDDMCAMNLTARSAPVPTFLHCFCG